MSEKSPSRICARSDCSWNDAQTGSWPVRVNLTHNARRFPVSKQRPPVPFRASATLRPCGCMLKWEKTEYGRKERRSPAFHAAGTNVNGPANEVLQLCIFRSRIRRHDPASSVGNENSVVGYIVSS
jgi:hypothetical protein